MTTILGFTLPISKWEFHMDLRTPKGVDLRGEAHRLIKALGDHCLGHEAGHLEQATAYWKVAPQSPASYIGVKTPSLKNLVLHPKGWTWQWSMNNLAWILLEQENCQRLDKPLGTPYGVMTKRS